MFLYQVINNTNETVIVSHAMMKAVNHAYISIVHDNFKNITSFDYIEKFETVTKEYAEQILKDIFNEDKMAISIVNRK